MRRSRPAVRSPQPAAASTPAAPWARALETVALAGLLLIVAMRPLISETYDSGLTAIDRATGPAGSISPATTAWFDLGILICVTLAAAGSALRRGRWRWTGLEPGWLLMLAAAIASTWAAGNKRLALNASADWLIAAMLVLVLPSVCRGRRTAALLLIVTVASGVTSLTRCAMQITSEFPDTRQHYFETRADFWGRQGVALDDPRVELFERRMAGTAATGFFPHSNVQAALLSLCGFAGLGLAGLVWPRRRTRAALIGMGTVLIACTIITQSKGGILAGGIGLVLLALAWAVAPAVQANRRKVLAAAWIVAVCACLGVILIGWVRGGLPGASLQFRWEYWKVTLQIILDRLWTGEGALNFDRAYLLYKPIEYPEEIKDPHNFVLSILAQWGLPGGLGLLWMLVAGSRRAFHALGAGGHGARGGEIPAWPDPRRALAWVAFLVAGFVLLRLLLLRGYWSSDDAAGAALAMFDLGLYGLVWSVSVGTLTLLILRAHAGSGAWEPEAAHAAAVRYRLALLCGIAAFLLHNLVEFSLFYPGTLTPFAALAALVIARDEHKAAGTRPARHDRYIPIVSGVLAITLFVWLVCLPVTRADALLNRARTAASPEIAERLLREATLADRYDPTAPTELAGLYARFGGARQAIETIQIALERDPMNADLYRMQSKAYELWYADTGQREDLEAAVRAARMAVRLYPASPDQHLFLAEVLTRAAQTLADPGLAEQAARAYERALSLDAARPGTDEVRKWTPSRRDEIEKRAQAAAAGAITTTATAPDS